MTHKSKLVHDSKYSFSNYRSITKDYDFFMAKCYKLSKFYHGLTESRSIVPRTEQNKNKKMQRIKMLQVYIIKCQLFLLKDTIVSQMKEKEMDKNI